MTLEESLHSGIQFLCLHEFIGLFYSPLKFAVATAFVNSLLYVLVVILQLVEYLLHLK